MIEQAFNTTSSDNIEICHITSLPKRPKSGGYYKFQNAVVNDYNHTLHKYPAKFIPQFPQWALDYANCGKESIVLDPFCGSGTTLVEAGLKGCNSIGYDISPLAVLISKAKASIIQNADLNVNDLTKKIISEAKSHSAALEKEFVKRIGSEYLGMHRTWSNWFRPKELSELISLRNAINTVIINENLKAFAIVCLSSIVKSCSFLSEDQLKVRYDSSKKIKNPFEAFDGFFSEQVKKQIKLSSRYISRNASFEISQADAANLPYTGNDVDLIVTSPPYINAVDYTMAHKYNLFVLKLINPDDFWNHSHQYIGVTERAVKSEHLKERPTSSIEKVNEIIDELWTLGTATSKNRSYVVAQYFNGMRNAFKEMNRVLKENGKVAFVIGESNRICGRTVPTSRLLIEIAQEVGFYCELDFVHVLNNRSSVRANRGQGAGEIKNEIVIVFNKNK